MELCLELNQRNLNLSIAEALTLSDISKYNIMDNYLFFKTNKTSFFGRLAYTRNIFRVLFSCDKKDLIQNVAEYDWNALYKSNYSVRTLGAPAFSEKELASLIWNKLSKPHVQLNDANTRFVFLFLNTKVIATILLHQNDEDFNKRKSHRLPEPHPSSLHPQLARAMVNLTGARKGEVILDPFCGAGSILIEAGSMELKPIGSDINNIMINRSKRNLDYFNIKNYTLRIKDALTIKKRYKHIVTDLPYGRNTSTEKKRLDQLYPLFLENLKNNTYKTAIIGFPDFIDHKMIIRKAKLSIKKEFTYYLHKTLSKKIIVLE